MTRGKIKFNSVESVRRFVSIVEKCKSDIDVQYGSIFLDGKSLEGLLSVQLGLELDCIFHSKLEDVLDIISEISEYIVKDFVEK